LASALAGRDTVTVESAGDLGEGNAPRVLVADAGDHLKGERRLSA
jgi:hypothetical protein